MAQYVKRGKGWQARIQWRDNFGKRHTKSRAGFATKTLARKWATENESQLNKGVSVDKDVSFYAYFCHWTEVYKKPKVAKQTLTRYKINAKAIKNYFGNASIKSITRSQYQEFLNDYGKDHAPKTVRKLNTCLRSSVKSAILDDFLIKDFTQGVTISGDESRVLHVQYLSVKEIKALIKVTRSNLDYRFTSRFMILTAIYTGMRKEEIQAITWKDINFSKQTITVNKAWRELQDDGESDHHFATHRFKKPKTESSNRIIKVNRVLLDDLNILREHSKSNMVFMNCFGTLPTSTALNHKLRDLLAQIGLHKRNFHFHSLRHSHVALLLASGMDIYAISKRLGHSDISMTANTYAYLIDEYKSETDQKIVKILNEL